MKNMMNLLANIDFKNLMMQNNCLAKAFWGFQFIFPPDKSGGNSKYRDNSKFGVNSGNAKALAHSPKNLFAITGFSQNIVQVANELETSIKQSQVQNTGFNRRIEKRTSWS
jgi:hypothetical protein